MKSHWEKRRTGQPRWVEVGRVGLQQYLVLGNGLDCVQRELVGHEAELHAWEVLHPRLAGGPQAAEAVEVDRPVREDVAKLE